MASNVLSTCYIFHLGISAPLGKWGDGCYLTAFTLGLTKYGDCCGLMDRTCIELLSKQLTLLLALLQIPCVTSGKLSLPLLLPLEKFLWIQGGILLGECRMRSHFTRFGVSFPSWRLANWVLRPTMNVSIAVLKRIVSFFQWCKFCLHFMLSTFKNLPRLSLFPIF